MLARTAGLFLVLCASSVLSFQFLSIGDWGTAAAKPNGKTMAKYNPEFLLAIGDNFYSRGVTSVDDPQFKSKFEDTFAGAVKNLARLTRPLISSIPL